MFTPMTPDDIQQAVAQAHHDAYHKAIKEGKTPEQAIKIADAAASAKGQALRTSTPSAVFEPL